MIKMNSARQKSRTHSFAFSSLVEKDEEFVKKSDPDQIISRERKLARSS